MTELHQRIIRLVKRAGADGISGDELFRLAYEHRELMRYVGSRHNMEPKRRALKSLIWQINRDYGLRIRGSHCAGGWYWWT